MLMSAPIACTPSVGRVTRVVSLMSPAGDVVFHEKIGEADVKGRLSEVDISGDFVVVESLGDEYYIGSENCPTGEIDNIAIGNYIYMQCENFELWVR